VKRKIDAGIGYIMVRGKGDKERWSDWKSRDRRESAKIVRTGGKR